MKPKAEEIQSEISGGLMPQQHLASSAFSSWKKTTFLQEGGVFLPTLPYLYLQLQHRCSASLPGEQTQDATLFFFFL